MRAALERLMKDLSSSPSFLWVLSSYAALALSLTLLRPALRLGRGEVGGETPQTAKPIQLKEREFVFHI